MTTRTPPLSAALVLLLAQAAVGCGGGGGNGSPPPPPPPGTRLEVTLRRASATGTPEAAAGVRVLRHAVDTGAFLEERATDATGLADFADIGQARTSFTVIGPARVDSGTTVHSAISFLDFPTGAVTLRLDRMLALGRPPISTFTVAPSGPTTIYPVVRLASGVAGELANVPVLPDDVQSDGKFSLVVEHDDDGRIRACGAVRDASIPAGGATLPVLVDQGTSTVMYSSNEPVTLESVRVARRGVSFDFKVGRVRWQTLDGVDTCAGELPGADRVLLVASSAPGYDQVPRGNEILDSQWGKRVRRVFTALPTTSTVTMDVADVTLSGLDPTGATVTATTQGADVAGLDVVVTRWGWEPGPADRYEWTVVSGPDRATVTLPGLPADLSSLRTVASPYTVTQERLGTDAVAGFAAAGARLLAAGGDLDALAAPGDRVVSAWRAVNVFVPAYHVLMDQTYQQALLGTVTSDIGGIDCGPICSSGAFPVGTVMTLTATPNPGARFAGWGGDCASFGLTSPIGLVLDSFKSCTALFGSLPGGPYSLSVGLPGWPGLIQSDPAGILYGWSTTGESFGQSWAQFASGTAVTLCVTPQDTFTVFDVTWTGSCSGTGNCAVVSMDANKSCGADLLPRP